jgi:hypothetical protein
MRLRYKILTVGVIVGAIVGWLHFRHPVQSVSVSLPQGSDSLLVPLGGHPLADYGHGVKLVKQGNKLVVTPKVTGFPFDIGASVALGGRSSQFYLTTEVFYYRHFEILGGLGVTYSVIHPRAVIAVGYRLPWQRLDNVSVFTGLTSASEFIIGIYVRLGSN